MPLNVTGKHSQLNVSQNLTLEMPDLTGTRGQFNLKAFLLPARIKKKHAQVKTLAALKLKAIMWVTNLIGDFMIRFFACFLITVLVCTGFAAPPPGQEGMSGFGPRGEASCPPADNSFRLRESAERLIAMGSSLPVEVTAKVQIDINVLLQQVESIEDREFLAAAQNAISANARAILSQQAAFRCVRTNRNITFDKATQFLAQYLK